MKLIADFHTHTISSGHAYSTVNELAAAAATKGLLALAITDHGPSLPGGPHIYHFGAMRFIPQHISGVRILLGCEANIINAAGEIDLPDNYLSRLDFVMAGFHESCGFDNQGIIKNTETLLKTMDHPMIKAISHPGNPLFPIDYAAVASKAAESGTALEINNSSFTLSRCGSGPNCEKLARLAADLGVKIVVGSDAHIAQNVGEFDQAISLIQSAGIPEEQVVNSSMERVKQFLDLD